MARRSFEGLRDFLECLRAEGELHTISEAVDAEREVGALATRRRSSLAMGVEPTVQGIADTWRPALPG